MTNSKLQYNCSSIYLSDDPNKSPIKSLTGIKVGDRIRLSKWTIGDKNLSTSVSPEMIVDKLTDIEAVASSPGEVIILEFETRDWLAVGSMPKVGMICKRGDDTRFIK